MGNALAVTKSSGVSLDMGSKEQYLSESSQRKVHFPPKFKQIFEPFRFKVFYGGRGGAKSYSICMALIIISTLSKHKILCCREYQNSISDSVYSMLVEIIDKLNLNHIFDTTKNRILCKTTGSVFIFKGLKTNPHSIKSLFGLTIVFIEEASVISTDSLTLLVPTIREAGSELWVAMNVEAETDPAYVQFIKIRRKNSLVVNVNWDDNPYISKELLDEKDHMYETDPELAEHIWGGKPKKHSTDLIFRNKVVVGDFTLPAGTIYLSGLDFGFSSDPFACVVGAVIEEELFIEYETGGHHVEVDQYGPYLRDILPSKNQKITCDSASPALISLLKRQGFNVEPCTKYAGSVEDGISFIKSFKRVVVHTRCVNTKREMTKDYKYKRDPKTKDVSNVPIDKDNHWCDAIRYMLNSHILNDNLTAQQWKNLIK